MTNQPAHAPTSVSLESADTTLLALINKGYSLHTQIEDLQAKLDIIDRTTDAAFTARNELAVAHGGEVFLDLDTFIEAAS